MKSTLYNLKYVCDDYLKLTSLQIRIIRLVIDLDEKYNSLFYEAIKAAKATTIEDDDFRLNLPEHVKKY